MGKMQIKGKVTVLERTRKMGDKRMPERPNEDAYTVATVLL